MSAADSPATRPALLVGLALCLEAVVLLWPATMGGEVFFRRDVHLMWSAQAEALVRSFHEGGWPLWNPLVSFGQPLLADANGQLFYPPALLRLLLPAPVAYTLMALLHLVLAGCGAAALARRLGLGTWPAALAGATYMASGPLLSLVDTWNQLAGAAWMPWVIAAGLATLRPGGLRSSVRWGLLTALQLLAGAPEMAVLAWTATGILWLVERPATGWSARRVGLAAAKGMAAAVLTLALAAAQWVPALEAARRAGRTSLPREARVYWSIRPAHLAQAVCPVPLHRLALAPETRNGLFGAPDPLLPSLYLGVVAGALVAAAASRATLGLLAAGAVSTALALGAYGGAYDLAILLAPPLRAFRYPAKALVLTALCWALLAAFGLAAIAGARRRAAAASGTLALVSLAAAGAFLLAGGAPLGLRLGDGGAAGAPAPRLLAAAVLGVAALAAALRLADRAVIAPLLTGLVVLDLAAAHLDLNPTAPAALYTHEPAALATARDPEGGRLYAFDYMEPGAGPRTVGREAAYLLARAPAGWDLRAAQALALREALYPPTPAARGAEGSYDRDVPGLEPAPLALLKEAFRRTQDAETRLRLLRLAAVTRVAALHEGAGAGLVPLGRYEGLFADPVRVFAVPGARPRHYLVGTARVVADDLAALAALASAAFDPAREVLLAEGRDAADTGFVGTSVLRERRADRLLFETDASGPGVLVVVDAWDPGWRARVDGVPAPLARANLAFRGVEVPSGRHVVELAFLPSTLAPALATSAASAVLLALGFAAARLRSGARAAR